MADFDWRGRTAVLRADLNVPLNRDGAVADDARVAAAAETINFITQGGGRVAVLSHLGRPAGGRFGARLSLERVAECLQRHCRQPVQFVAALPEALPADVPAQVFLLENTRFNVGENENENALSMRYAQLGDVFVMDAFASAHRAEASVVGVAESGLPVCAGLLVAAELQAVDRVLGNLQRPLVGVFGGAKISTKINVIRRMAELCDTLIVGGGIANTLLQAQGCAIGVSITQGDMSDAAADLLARADGRLLLPSDVVVVRADDDAGAARMTGTDDIGAGEKIVDIGEQTRAQWAAVLNTARTIVWNGPVGWFEKPPYAAGTQAVARAVAQSEAYSLIGGGDTIAAARQCGMLDAVSYVSTAGGALLEYLAGERLPGLAALR